MVDYKVYDSLNVPEAEKKAEEIAEMHIGAWRDFTQHRPPAKAKKRKKGAAAPPASAVRLPFCEELIKGTTCNLLMPPCDGDGSHRYRKPCKAFHLALQHGCNWTMNVGDLSFAEPPDCFELPIRAYTEAEYLDAAALGAEGEPDSGGRADDILKIAALLEEEALTEHAVFMYLQSLRYRSDDAVVCARACVRACVWCVRRSNARQARALGIPCVMPSYTYAHVHTRKHMHACMHMRVHIHTHTHTHTGTLCAPLPWVHTHAHTHTHTGALARLCPCALATRARQVPENAAEDGAARRSQVSFPRI